MMNWNHIQEVKKRRISHLIIVFILFISIILTYSQVKDYAFVNYDDPRYVKTFANEAITLEFLASLLTSFDASNWHPLTWMSHIIDTRFFGMNAGAHHLVNVFFHIINTWLLYFIFTKTTGEAWKSCLVAGLFAIHPLHVESVAWVAERKDVLSTMFWMLTIAAYVRYAGKPRLITYTPVFLFFLLGLMAKPMVVTLPFVLLLLDIWPLRRFTGFRQPEAGDVPAASRLVRLIMEKLPLLVLSAAACLLTVLAQKSGGAINSLEFYSLKIRLANAIVAYAGYLGKVVIPTNLAVFYPYPSSIPMWKILLGSAVLISISLLTVKRFKSQPYLLVGWLWYLGTLVPVIGLVQVGTQSMADRYTYIPLIGVFVMAAWGLPALLGNHKHKKTAILCTALLIYGNFLILTWVQVRYWADSFSLYRHAIAVTDKNHVAHGHLGAALYNDGKVYESIRHFMRALEIKPDYYEALANLRAAALANRNIYQAIQSLENLLSLYPENAGLYYTLGALHAQKGALAAAVENYRKAVVLYPNFAQAQFDLGHVLALSGDHENAIDAYKKAIEIQSDLVWAYYNAAALLSLENRVEESLEMLEKAIAKGFKDWAYIEHDEKINNIRNTPFYKSIVVN